MRIALLTSLLLTACTVGDTGTGATNNGTPDAGSSGGSDSGGTPTGTTGLGACVNKEASPPPAYQHKAGGTSNAGANCIVAQCHANNAKGVDAPGFQFAGTVYLTGTTNPAAGVTVRLKSADKTLPPVVTDTDGNFYFPAMSISGTFTAITDVTGCPTVKPMITSLQSGGPGSGSCNLCHTAAAGGTTTPIYY